MQRSFNADLPLDGDMYGRLLSGDEDNGISPAYFFMSDDEEDWEDLELAFLILLFEMWKDKRPGRKRKTRGSGSHVSGSHNNERNLLANAFRHVSVCTLPLHSILSMDVTHLL